MIMSRLMTSAFLVVAVASSSAAEPKNKSRSTARTADKSAAPAPTEKGRDWSLIDTNKDGYISPDEMDAWLKANPGPQK